MATAAVDTQAEGRAPNGDDEHRNRRRLVIGIVVCLAAAGLAVGLWLRWLYSANALAGGVAGFGGDARRPVGATIYSPPFVFAKGDRNVTVDVRSVAPHVTENSAHATIRVLVCHRNNTTSHFGSDDLSFCERAHPFKPGKLTIGEDSPGTDSIILAITTHTRGKVVIEGVHVSYRQGMRRGSTDSGPRWEVRAVRRTAPPPSVTGTPTVTAVDPTSGIVSGGTRVTVTGTNFSESVSIRFGSLTAAGKQVTVVSRNTLVVVTPPHGAGVVDLRVVSSHGTSAVVAADRYTYR